MADAPNSEDGATIDEIDSRTRKTSTEGEIRMNPTQIATHPCINDEGRTAQGNENLPSSSGTTPCLPAEDAKLGSTENEPDRVPQGREELYDELAMLLHAIQCKKKQPKECIREGLLDRCNTVKTLLAHMRRCYCWTDGKPCPVPHCSSSKKMLSHWMDCNRSECFICCPIIKRWTRGFEDTIVAKVSLIVRPSPVLLDVEKIFSPLPCLAVFLYLGENTVNVDVSQFFQQGPPCGWGCALNCRGSGESSAHLSNAGNSSTGAHDLAPSESSNERWPDMLEEGQRDYTIQQFMLAIIHGPPDESDEEDDSAYYDRIPFEDFYKRPSKCPEIVTEDTQLMQNLENYVRMVERSCFAKAKAQKSEYCRLLCVEYYKIRDAVVYRWNINKATSEEYRKFKLREEINR